MDFTKYDTDGRELPLPLANISDPPKQLFWTGNSLDLLLAKPRVAIVGSRKVSAYGRQVTYQLARELAEHGIVIVSGLALGVDAVAHNGALEGGGETIAVLPCSLDRIYPATNTALARKIVRQRGCLVSEYARGSPFVFKYNFVARNRIIAGLSDAVILTEAAEHSGSLYTAQFAVDLGQEVMVVPGNITSPTSVGTNNLLKSGASPITNTLDVLRIMGLDHKFAPALPKGQTAAEQLVLNLLSDGIHEGNELFSKTSLPASEFNQTMTMLEITGKIKAGGNNSWY